MDRPLRCSRRDRLDQSPFNGIVDDGGRLARDIGLKILQDALEASETGFRQLGFLMLHRDRYLTERQRPRNCCLSCCSAITKSERPGSGHHSFVEHIIYVTSPDHLCEWKACAIAAARAVCVASTASVALRSAANSVSSTSAQALSAVSNNTALG